MGLSHQLQGEDSAECDKPVPLLQISEAAVSQDLLDRLCRAPQLGMKPTWCSAPGQGAAISSHGGHAAVPLIAGGLVLLALLTAGCQSPQAPGIVSEPSLFALTSACPVPGQ